MRLQNADFKPPQERSQPVASRMVATAREIKSSGSLRGSFLDLAWMVLWQPCASGLGVL